MSNRINQKPSQKVEGLGQNRLNRRGLLNCKPPEYVKNGVLSTIKTTIVLSVLGVGLVGCTSWKPDPPLPCDETQRQERQISNLPGCAPLIHKDHNYDPRD
jgi:hypothetical protein